MYVANYTWSHFSLHIRRITCFLSDTFSALFVHAIFEAKTYLLEKQDQRVYLTKSHYPNSYQRKVPMQSKFRCPAVYQQTCWDQNNSRNHWRKAIFWLHLTLFGCINHLSVWENPRKNRPNDGPNTWTTINIFAICYHIVLTNSKVSQANKSLWKAIYRFVNNTQSSKDDIHVPVG